MSEIKISPALMDTIIDNPHIQEVYFTKDNNHYFNKHELDKTGKFYGYLKVEQVVSHTIGGRQVFKMKQVANPKALIVETLTRDEILDMDTTDEKEIFEIVRSSAKHAGKKAKAKGSVAA